MNQKSLLDSVRPIFTALFEAFATGKRPTSLPPAPTNVHSTLTLGLDDFGAFVKAVKLGLLASEEGIWFSQYAAIEHARTCLTLHGFFDFVAHLCRDSRRCKLLAAYLESIGVSEASLVAPSATAPTTLMAFQPEDNLLHCLSRLKPSSAVSSNVAPWKCMYSLYCDFAVLWDDDAASAPVTAAPSTQPTTYREVVAPTSHATAQDGDALHQALRLLAVLYKQYGNDANAEMWVNTRLSRKLRLQLHDVLSITSGSYPSWCDELTRQFKFLFPLELRSMLFRTTAFGCSRSLHWLRDHLEPSTESDEVLSISPLPKERAKVERSDILKSADAVMKVHGKRKAILDIVFVGERGYGSGVTAAFYSAAAQALQSNAPLALWVRGDEDTSDDLIRHPNGLFPLPTVAARGRSELLDRFRLIGRLAGKALLDDRLLPLPLAPHFLQLVLHEPIAMHDLPTIFLEPGRILYSLYKAAQALQTHAPGSVTIEGTPVADWLEAVDLSFVDPCTQTELVANGAVLSVTTANLSAYVDHVLDIWLGRGIAGQVQAFRDGLNDVVATEKLRLLHAHEIQAALCGTVDVEWTEASLRQTIKLAHGYTATSAPIEYFIQTLVSMTTSQRRAFLLYATGCPNLPPGGVGLETLKPPFEVVRRVISDDEDVDRALPFARTCTNTLHLPAYSSKAILSTQLEYAVLNSKGVIDRD
ncbi:hypothetical protein SPRG_21524 [Saprolegnia parasitica CBS 223.65]|uniref:HECT domain-containing protein n=1 Tax=Saprolegnia parasitica (strain CBS 223.65) TaxID=695850 RepID=A0A067BS20_SAPPC|nr:hypothetical protein SPRG_21524 [Saprolegnia parasitica CBS 223.65]KDO19595.1 hypothetical protein SPRG_21524 [Saprolegnia parasitica CBS 223.65]|eukprot:XP_012209703.1 hypothetical protein SPRG_21524 [Saprolegnia parasitica CBS 223.65]